MAYKKGKHNYNKSYKKKQPGALTNSRFPSLNEQHRKANRRPPPTKEACLNKRWQKPAEDSGPTYTEQKIYETFLAYGGVLPKNLQRRILKGPLARGRARKFDALVLAFYTGRVKRIDPDGTVHQSAYKNISQYMKAHGFVREGQENNKNINTREIGG